MIFGVLFSFFTPFACRDNSAFCRPGTVSLNQYFQSPEALEAPRDGSDGLVSIGGLVNTSYTYWTNLETALVSLNETCPDFGEINSFDWALQIFDPVVQFGLPVPESVAETSVGAHAWFSMESHPFVQCSDGDFFQIYSSGELFLYINGVLARYTSSGTVRFSHEDVNCSENGVYELDLFVVQKELAQNPVLLINTNIQNPCTAYSASTELVAPAFGFDLTFNGPGALTSSSLNASFDGSSVFVNEDLVASGSGSVLVQYISQAAVLQVLLDGKLVLRSALEYAVTAREYWILSGSATLRSTYPDPAASTVTSLNNATALVTLESGCGLAMSGFANLVTCTSQLSNCEVFDIGNGSYILEYVNPLAPAKECNVTLTESGSIGCEFEAITGISPVVYVLLTSLVLPLLVLAAVVSWNKRFVLGYSIFERHKIVGNDAFVVDQRLSEEWINANPGEFVRNYTEPEMDAIFLQFKTSYAAAMKLKRLKRELEAPAAGKDLTAFEHVWT